jgi:MoxR-like ATPase
MAGCDMRVDVKHTRESGVQQTPLQTLADNLGSVIRGKPEIITDFVMALLAGGSVLIEDVPGVGKTTLAKSLAASVELDFQRVQCTPDLLPADVFGFSVFNPQAGTFSFRKGPVFTNILLVDEINRASPRTQSALLEAMAERQVTLEGTHYDLPDPFMVIATQNPHGFQGTFSLPEAQLDRFLFRLSLNYPDAESEVDILFDQMDGQPVRQISPVLSVSEIRDYQLRVRRVVVERIVAKYLVDLVRQTREHPRIRIGCSPRGSLMLCRAAQACAFVDGREFVLPDDVQRVAPLVLAHRIVTRSMSDSGADSQRDIIEELVRQVEIPV